MYTHLLGIDYGASKVGLALSEHGEFSHAYDTIYQRGRGKLALAKDIIAVCVKERVEHIVFGLPFSMRGQNRENERTKRVRQFAAFLEEQLQDRLHGTSEIEGKSAAIPIRIHFQNEQLTTRLAGHFTAGTGPAHGSAQSVGSDDAKAAELVLQQFLATHQANTPNNSEHAD